MLGPFDPVRLLELLEHEHGWPVFVALEATLVERHRSRRPQTLAERSSSSSEPMPVVPRAEGKAHGPRPKWKAPT